jgi:ferredoxin-NADP reductase
MPTPLAWQIGTVAEIRPETAQVKTFRLQLPAWHAHRAGQHYDVRLTTEDGYQAQRSYSVASPPATTGAVELTVERITDGEVSPYFHDVLQPGDGVEVRGPIGGYFVWQPELGGPLLLVAGGSGIVPLMAMLRQRAATNDRTPAVLLASWRTIDDVIYRTELDELADRDERLRVVHTLTRARPAGWQGYDRRIDESMLADVMAPFDATPLAYVCGPTLLVEAVSSALVNVGMPAGRVRTERFGPTG